MTKRTSLANLTALKDAPTASEKPQDRSKGVSASKEASGNDRPSRSGKSHVGGYFSPEVRRQLKALAAEQDKTVQQLLGEGLNLMFASYGKAEIAETERVERS